MASQDRGVPCNITQQHLFDLLAKHLGNKDVFLILFFQPVYSRDGVLDLDSVPAKFTDGAEDPVAKVEFVLTNGVRIPRLDRSVRCDHCGFTIAEHHTGSFQPTAKHRCFEEQDPNKSSVSPCLFPHQNGSQPLSMERLRLIKTDPASACGAAAMRQRSPTDTLLQQYKAPPLPATAVANDEVELLNRDIEIECMLQALRDAITLPSQEAQHHVIATVGIPGSGKTEMLRQVCETIAHEAFAPRTCRTAYLTFQLYHYANPRPPPAMTDDKSEFEKCFTRLLLISCGETPRGACGRLLAEAGRPATAGADD